MSTRNQALVLGNETVLAVNKTDAEPATMVVLRCATDINYSSSIEMLTASCYEGETTLPSGKSPAATFAINGNVKEYKAADIATNVSSRELNQWHLTKARKLWSYARPHEGDTVRTAYGYVTSYTEQGSADGLQTYSATITVEGDVEITTVAA